MVKKIIIVALCAVAAYAFELDFSKKFETFVTPDTAVAKIAISVNDESEAKITARLEKIATYINGYTQVQKEGGNFRVNANYIYKEGERIQQGYVGFMEYRIVSKEIEDLDIFLEDLLLIKQNENIEIRSYGYEVSPNDYNDALEKLRFQAIVWSIAYAKELSAKVYKQCEVKNISFAKNITYPRTYAMEKTAVLDANFAPKPTQHDESLTLTPTLILECK
jgi:uncharacterized protein YggE